MTDFMFDTNAFNRALDKGTDPAELASRGTLFVTHIQHDELLATKRTERLDALLRVFQSVEAERVPTAAAVWDVSKWGEAEWGDGDGFYGAPLESLNKMNNSRKNNAHDVLIALTAIKRGQVLVTTDGDLAGVCGQHGGSAITTSSAVTWMVRPSRTCRWPSVTGRPSAVDTRDWMTGMNQSQFQTNTSRTRSATGTPIQARRRTAR